MAYTEPGGGRRSARSRDRDRDRERDRDRDRDRSNDASGEPLDQRLDRWVSAGRQLVDGVSGARPGSRAGERRPAGRSGGGSGGLGRWVEEKLDWLLEDGDDWREPWQEPPPPQARPGRPAEVPPIASPGRGSASGRPEPGDRDASGARRVRRSLEAVSRRGAAAGGPPLRAAPAGEPDAADDWPSEDSFRLNRWQRPAAASRGDEAGPAPGPAAGERLRNGAAAAGAPPGRPMPRSSRRR